MCRNRRLPQPCARRVSSFGSFQLPVRRLHAAAGWSERWRIRLNDWVIGNSQISSCRGSAVGAVTIEVSTGSSGQAAAPVPVPVDVTRVNCVAATGAGLVVTST